MLILLVRSQPDRIFDWLIAVIGAWIVTSLIMLSSYKLYKLLGKRGLIAVERLMGMVLVAISVQMLLDGITTYLGIIPVSWILMYEPFSTSKKTFHFLLNLITSLFFLFSCYSCFLLLNQLAQFLLCIHVEPLFIRFRSKALKFRQKQNWIRKWQHTIRRNNVI